MSHPVRLLLLAACAASIAQPPAPLSHVVHLPRTSRRISLNGDLSEWRSAASIDFAAQYARGERDNLTTVKLLWDKRRLYVAFIVKDTELNGRAVSNDDPDMWLDDAIELMIDTRHNAAEVEQLDAKEFIRRGGDFWGTDMVFLQEDDFHILVNVRGTVTAVRGTGLWLEGRSWGYEIPLGVVANGTVNDNGDTDNGYVVEMALDWRELGIRPKDGLVLGADFGVEDVDGKGRFPCDWCEIGNFLQPHRWGDLVLEDSRVHAAQLSLIIWTLSLGVFALAGLGLVLLIVRRFRKRSTGDNGSALEHRRAAFAVQAEAYIGHHYVEPDLTIDRAARDLFVSRRYLQMVLKSHSHASFTELLARYRLQRAAELLSSTTESVTEVGFEVGYRSADSFAVAFKKIYGKPPGEYRRMPPGES